MLGATRPTQHTTGQGLAQLGGSCLLGDSLCGGKPAGKNVQHHIKERKHDKRITYRLSHIKFLVKDQHCKHPYKQGCPLSPLLFSLYINDMGREISEGIEGAVTGDRVICVSHMLYADDLGLTTNDPGEMQTMLNNETLLKRVIRQMPFLCFVRYIYPRNIPPPLATPSSEWTRLPARVPGGGSTRQRCHSD